MFDRSLSVSLHTLNYPSCILGFGNSHRSVYKTRLNPVLAMPPPSVFLTTDENGKFQEFNNSSGSNEASLGIDSLHNQAKTVGIIGGVSVKSTLNFLTKLVQLSGQENSIPLVLCSDPLLSKELVLYQRNSFPSVNGKNGCAQVDPTLIVENLRSKRIFLEKSGARCIIMPCHLSHTWHDQISSGCSVPFLHVSECVAKELKEAKLKPLEAGSPLRIGVLATNAGFYQDKLQSEVISFKFIL